MTGLFLGFLLGFVMQRGRFCMAGGMRDLYLFRDGQMTIAILLIITLHSVGLFAFVSLGWAQLPAEEPFRWLATLVGGLAFGIGMALAGSCSTGAYYRSAEGLAGSMLAVLGFVVSSWYFRQPSGQSLFAPLMAPSVPDASLLQTFHLPPWLAIFVLAMITVWLVHRQLRRRVQIPRLKPRKQGVAHWLFEARWPPFLSAVLIALIALLAWPSSLASGKVGSLGISGASAQLFALLTEGKTSFFGWGGYLLTGLFVGALVAAWGSQELRFRSPGPRALMKSLTGGLLMGIGSGLAGGCMLGNTLINTAWFSWQGWVFIPCILFGSWLVSYFTLVLPNSLLQTKEA